MAPFPIQAQNTNPPQSVLVVNVHGPVYDAEGSNVLLAVANAGASATFVNLDTNGVVASLLQSNQYEQVWVFDLSHLTDEYPFDWQAIADWYEQHSNLPIICDARMLSSFWYGRSLDEGQRLAENYYVNLAREGGGLVLGTDHYEYNDGINTINALIGLSPFSGFFVAGTIPVDAASPLMSSPNDLTAGLYDDSTTGKVPYGLQPNGRVLHPIAWHGGDQFLPGISTTLRSASEFRVQIVPPTEETQFVQGESVVLAVTQSNGVAPVQYNWQSDRDGALGVGSNLVVSNLSVGRHIITVAGVDGGNRLDVSSWAISVVSLTLNIALNIDPKIEISWQSVADQPYQIQWAAKLPPTVWSNLGPPVLGNGATNTVRDTPGQGESRFYRLILP